MPAILCNNYDINWIRKNLDSDGEFKKYLYENCLYRSFVGQ